MKNKKPMEKNPHGENDFNPVRFIDAGIRLLDDNESTFELSFSSEEPYNRWYGSEILDHSASSVDLKRLETIGVVLFNHNKDKVIGRVDNVWIDGGRGKAQITFDSDEEAEKIRKKVESGTLRGVSVGYVVDEWEEVKPGYKSLDQRFAGPCHIAKKWTPLEISIVSVPADHTVGVGRNYEERKEEAQDKIKLWDWIIKNNENSWKEELNEQH